ncbi:MAG: UvrB/UvrC motif-containing protein [Phycisphaerales bacterium JB039]
MTQDISRILKDWPHEPGKLNVRVVHDPDGEPWVQVRLDLGILQMRVDGRPDGTRPSGCESLLEHFEQLADELEVDGSVGFDEDPPSLGLSADDCRAIREEATQYYHRYVALFMLEDFDGVVRDTTRNLRALDLIARHAADEPERQSMERFRPFILFMRARAIAGQALKDGEPKAAALALDEGLDALREYFERQGAPELFEQSTEVETLRGMKEALQPRLPVSQTAELRKRLEEAVQQENYELAAILRDELSMLGQRPST